MTILKQEIRSQKTATLIWSLSIGFMIAVCILMFPEMKSQMSDVNKLFASMGSFTQAFGMDKLNFGTLIGFYAVEAGNVLGLGGAFFAAIVGVSALMKEEHGHTAIMNVVVLVFSIVSILAIGEEVFWQELLLIHLSYLLMQFEIAGICFGISAFLTRGGIGIGVGVAGFMYLLNIIANITESAKVLKYISAFGYTESSEIINNHGIEVKYLLPGMVLMIIGIVCAYGKYTKKDLR